MNDLSEDRQPPTHGGAASAGLPWLVADVGGTNARFGWVAAPERGVEHVRTLTVSAHASPEAAAAAYLAQIAPARGGASPQRAGWAVATVVDGDTVELTNSDWRFSRRSLQRALGVERLCVLNDFEALALSLPRLTPAQFRPHAALPKPNSTLAVIGPGTGLGVAAVVPTRHGWVAVPGEGGHATLAPADDFESALLLEVRRHYAHVSAERLLSGIGLPVLHAAVTAVLGLQATPQTAPQIVERALAGDDEACSRTIDSFCALLGGFAGNVALTLGASGGVFIGGGIVPRLGERFSTSQFRARFEAKGRFAAYLADVPTAVITDTLTALTGAALAIEQDGR